MAVLFNQLWKERNKIPHGNEKQIVFTFMQFVSDLYSESLNSIYIVLWTPSEVDWWFPFLPCQFFRCSFFCWAGGSQSGRLGSSAMLGARRRRREGPSSFNSVRQGRQPRHAQQRWLLLMDCRDLIGSRNAIPTPPYKPKQLHSQSLLVLLIWRTGTPSCFSVILLSLPLLFIDNPLLSGL